VRDRERSGESHPVLTRAHERLREELVDDGITLPGSPDHVDLLLAELEHARRPPVHEGRTHQYGSFVLPSADPLRPDPLRHVADLVELIDLDLPIEQCRRFADGRSSYVVFRPDRPVQLACFRRSVQFEADLVELELATGATIVQRTMMGVPRLFTPTGVVEWNGRQWRMRPSAREYLPLVGRAVPEAPREVLIGLLDLASHWLSPSRIGATFLLDLDARPHDDHGQDHSAALPSPALSVAERAHYPAMYAVLSQTDLATLVSVDGTVTRFGVGLRSSEESEAAVHLDAGMRHRSAARYTWDHHHTVAFVVSEDGPVTLFRRGTDIAVCAAGRTGGSAR
jgi:DNA integrity scanning protein DisA with diadenylate cyclase activity